jgi:hypothetical protein
MYDGLRVSDTLHKKPRRIGPGMWAPHSAPPFCVVENFLLETHTMANLPAKQGYRSHRILDFARMGGVAREPQSSIDMALLVEGALLKARPDRQDVTLKVQERVASSYK